MKRIDRFLDNEKSGKQPEDIGSICGFLPELSSLSDKHIGEMWALFSWSCGKRYLVVDGDTLEFFKDWLYEEDENE
jgi:hypothetical protein